VSAFAGTTALWYASRATGIVAFLLLTLVMLIGITVSRKGRVPGLPRFAVLGLHRRISLLAVVFVAVHVLSAVADPYVSIRLAAIIVPFASAYQPVPTGLGAVALDLGFAVLVTSLLRKRIGWRAWRAVHWLAYAIYPVAVLHGFLSAKDLRSGWLLAMTVACLISVAGAVAWRVAEARRYPRQRQRPVPGANAQARPVPARLG
jgi:methionine sulfoxide reductase heme-binding subunit